MLSPKSPSQSQILPHYLLVKIKKAGGKLRKNFTNIFQMFMNRNIGKGKGSLKASHCHSIISYHFSEKVLKMSPSFFAQSYNKMGRYMLGTERF
jgi:hypothetical protein